VPQAAAAGHRVRQRHPQGQLDLERRGGRTVDGVTARILPRVLARTAASWHDDAAGRPVTRSPVACDR
jgi:hypothetical protein